MAKHRVFKVEQHLLERALSRADMQERKEGLGRVLTGHLRDRHLLQQEKRENIVPSVLDTL